MTIWKYWYDHDINEIIIRSIVIKKNYDNNNIKYELTFVSLYEKVDDTELVQHHGLETVSPAEPTFS